MSSEIPDVVIRRALNASVLRAVRALSLGLSLFYAILVALVLGEVLPEAAARPMLVPWAIGSLILAMMFVVLRTKGAKPEWAHPAYVVLGAVVLVNSGLLLRTGAPPPISVVFLLIILGTSIIVLSRILFLATATFAFLTWGSVAWSMWPAAETTMWALVLLAGSIIGFAAQFARARALISLESARYSAQRLAAIVEASHDAIISFDLEGKVLTWNRGAAALYGYDPSQVVGRHVEMLYPAHLKAELQYLLERGRAGQSTALPETFRRTAAGELVPVAVSVGPIRDSTGAVIALSSFAVDLRPRKALDEERARVIRRDAELQAAQQLSRLKSEFINVAAHELYTPLTPIRMRLHELQQSITPKNQQALATLQRNVDRLQRVVDEIVHVAQIQGTGVVSQLEAVPLKPILEEVLARKRGGAETKHQVLDFKVEGGWLVKADENRLADAITNLVDNAIKFTPDGGHISVTARDGNVNEVVVEIKDSGPGLDPSRAATLFETFTVMEGHERTSSPGWGFGLFVSHRIIEAHGGKIRVESEGVGKGCNFVVTLPTASAAQQRT